MESFVLFTLFYIWFSSRFLFPPQEFVSLGLTVESIFSSFLGSDAHSFIHYHIKRTAFTLMTHCCLPLVYVVVASYMFPEWTIQSKSHFWSVFVALTLLPPAVFSFIIYSWYDMNWRKHPIAKKLTKFVTQGSDINQIAKDVDQEFRSIDKVIIKCNSVTTVVATDNWLIKISPYDLCIAHQSDTVLEVSSSAQYRAPPGSVGGAQYLNIDVKSSRSNVDTFQIRINSVDFKNLQDKVSRPINIMDNIVVHQSLTDQFVTTFKKHVEDNPKIAVIESSLGVCIGCLLAAPNVRIFTSCGDVSGPDKCKMCYCPPLWCIDCIAKWFASRQDQDKPDTWLSSKCTCPMCRSTFCILDVCPITGINQDTETDINENENENS